VRHLLPALGLVLCAACADDLGLSGADADLPTGAAAPAPPVPDATPVLALALTASVDAVVADGAARVTITATTTPPVTGPTLQLTTTAGALDAASAILFNGEAVFVLTAPTEAALGTATRLTADVAGFVDAGLSGMAEARVAVDFTHAAPASTAEPTLYFDASPTQAVADGAGIVELRALVLGAPAGTIVTFTTTATGTTITPASAPTDADGAATARITAPSAPTTIPVAASIDGAAPRTVDVVFTEFDPTPDLTGAWAEVAWARVEITGGVVEPSPQRVVAPALVLATIARDANGDLRLTSKLCAIEFPDVQLAFGMGCSRTRPKYEAAYLAAMTPTVDPLVVEGAPGAWTVKIPDAGLHQASVVGADLADPEGDALPDSEDDARCTDPDGDGHPGVTLAIDGQDDKYVVFRSTTTKFAGDLVDDATITGETDGSSESRILNSDWLTETFSPGMRGLPSTFAMFRVDGAHGGDDLSGNDGVAGLSCADLVAAKDDLIGRAERPEPAICEAD
jgi:hypothetical protein